MLSKVFILFLSLCIATFPMLVNAQEMEQAIMQAQMDAAADINGFLWMGCGFLFGIFAVGAAYIIGSSPRAARLLGKSPEFVAVYTNAYRRKATGIRVTNSVIGCVGGAILSVIIISVAYSSE